MQDRYLDDDQTAELQQYARVLKRQGADDENLVALGEAIEAAFNDGDDSRALKRSAEVIEGAVEAHEGSRLSYATEDMMKTLRTFTVLVRERSRR